MINHFYMRAVRLTAVIFFISAFACFAQTGKGLLYRITGKGITQPSYLFGTVHLYDTVHYKLPADVFAKLPEVKRLLLELDFGKLNAMELMSALWIPDSAQYFNRYLTQAQLKKLSEIQAASPLLTFFGSKLYHMKPLFVSTLLVANGRSAQIDKELYDAAVQQKDSIVGIETVKEQIAALDAVPIPDQAKMLGDMLGLFTTADAMIQQMTKTYVKQDIDHMLEELNQSMPLDANFNDVLVVKRNAVMLGRILPHLGGKQGVMIAVGAGHLGGRSGLVQSLRKKGYTLTAIPVTFYKK